MASLVVAGDTSGSVTLAAPAVAGSTTLTLPTTSGTIVTTGSAASLTTSGNLTFTGTGNRILGDFSNGTLVNRVAFQTSTTNGATRLMVIPNGTSDTSVLNVFNNSDSTNAGLGSIGINAGDIRLTSGITGTGTYLPMTFYTGGSETIRLSATAKTLILAGGNASATGTGITFPATQSASSDANTLDDYEEGTWTPTISGSTTAGTGTYTVQTGVYTKIGNTVSISAWVAWSAHTGTGNLELTNYPFASIGTSNYRASGSFGWVDGVALTANNVATVAVVPSVTKSTMTQYPVGGGAASAVPMDSAGNLHFSITYQTA